MIENIRNYYEFNRAFMDAVLDNKDKRLNVMHLSEETFNLLNKECWEFQNNNHKLLENLNPLEAGRDFFLSRNTLNGGYSSGSELEKAAHKYSKVTLEFRGGLLFYKQFSNKL